MQFKYSINMSSQEQLQHHLVATGDDFIPPLAERVDIAEYATKLMLHANRIEAWQADRLVALVAVYMNNKACHIAYISSVSVERHYRGYKLAKELLQKTCQYCQSHGFKAIELEVNQSNEPAQQLYKTAGFVVVKTENSSLYMEKQLGDNHVATKL